MADDEQREDVLEDGLDEDEDEIIILSDEDGTERQFYLNDILPVDGREYAVLLPVDDEEDEGIILRVEEADDDSDEMALANIEDDEEWQRVVDAYNQLLEEDEDEDEEDENEDEQ